MIRNALRVVPSATIAVEKKHRGRETRSRPKIITPKKEASSVNAAKLSYADNGP
jgi:hypothetical protein